MPAHTTPNPSLERTGRGDRYNLMKRRAAGRPLNSKHYKGFPKLRKRRIGFSSSSLLLHLIRHSLRASFEKVKDCGTTTGHVGHVARTLMKDARRSLDR